MLQKSRAFTALLLRKYNQCPHGAKGLFEGITRTRKTATSRSFGVIWPNLTSNSYATLTKPEQEKKERLVRLEAERKRKGEVDMYLKIRSLIQKKRVEEALKSFEAFKQDQNTCTEVFYTKILTAFSRARSVEGVEKVFQNFMSDKYTPKQEHYDKIIRVYCTNQKVEKALQLAKHMIDAGSQLSSETFGWVIELCEKTGNIESANNIFKLFRDSGLPPSESLLRTVLHNRSEAEFTYTIQAKNKNHFKYLNKDNSNIKDRPSGPLPNINLDTLKTNSNVSVNNTTSSSAIK